MSVFAQRNFPQMKEAAILLLRSWGEEDELHLESDSENMLYFLKNNPSIVARLTERSHRTREQIKSELDFVSYLNKHLTGITELIPSLDNELVKTLNYHGKEYHLCVFKKAAGKILSEGSELNIKLGSSIARKCAEMTRLARNYRATRERKSFLESDHIANVESYVKDRVVLEELNAFTHWYESLPKNKNSYGLIHGDVHFGNFFIKDNDLTLFDFDDCFNGFFIQEVAVHLFYAELMFQKFNKSSHFENYKRNFIYTYKTYSGLAKEWFEYIDNFIHSRKIELLCWMYKMFDLSNLSPERELVFKKYHHWIEEGRGSFK